MSDGQTCLKGVKILDLTQFEAGPSCTEALAWLGADVVKLENPNGGDPGRALGGPAGKDDPYFLLFNANKKSITVNLKDPKGLALVKDLASQGRRDGGEFRARRDRAAGARLRRDPQDQSVDHLLPGEGLRRRQPVREEPRLRHDRAGLRRHDEHHRRARRPPAEARAVAGRHRHRHAAGDLHPGRAVRRKETGKGEHLQVAMQDAMLHYIRIAFAAQYRTGKAAGRAADSSVSGANPPMGTFPCKGGGLNDYVYVFTSRANPEHWRRLLKVIGREDLIGDARYETPAARAERADEVNAMISDWTKQHTKHEAMEIIGAAGVPAGAVLDTMELYNDQTFEQRGILQTIEHPTVGTFRMPAWPVRFDGRPPPVNAVAAARAAQRARC